LLPFLSVHSYEDGTTYIFQEFLCIDEVTMRLRWLPMLADAVIILPSSP
jgi:hypothetical protein